VHHRTTPSSYLASLLQPLHIYYLHVLLENFVICPARRARPFHKRVGGSQGNCSRDFIDKSRRNSPLGGNLRRGSSEVSCGGAHSKPPSPIVITLQELHKKSGREQTKTAGKSILTHPKTPVLHSSSNKLPTDRAEQVVRLPRRAAAKFTVCCVMRTRCFMLRRGRLTSRVSSCSYCNCGEPQRPPSTRLLILHGRPLKE